MIYIFLLALGVVLGYVFAICTLPESVFERGREFGWLQAQQVIERLEQRLGWRK